ncbi:MAG TPA: UDP-N-acetylmuramoyl-tripeptide--D-alanyl-D-alanine ligase [Candidatus Sulfotelmatobacter sp.]|nr:UDP-N-acetylmuramoyl-tripeptide--D-alanyl-D-alanine ligase [Candidatus Sulfotelmatobacter sp.]
MEIRSLKFVAGACDTEMLSGSPETEVKNVCTDSRTAKAGDLFFAIKGEKFDGHDFIAEVTAKKIAGVVIEKSRVQGLKPKIAGDVGIFAVDDVRVEFGKFAAAYRKEFSIPVICVGGSNGKTTTKELVASVLRQKLAVLWSEASFNNDIGVPTTLLRLENKHQAAVVEAGTNHPGELAPLVRIVQPKFGIITNIGREHLEFFGDVAGVAQEEGSLAELLPADGRLFLNGDNEWSEKIAARTKAKVVRVGFGEKNDLRAKKVRLDKSGTTFQVEVAEERLKGFAGEYRISLLGRHQVTNALFALAVGAELGLTRDEIGDGLLACPPAKMRMQYWEMNGVRVLEDCYNANADSMRAALETLCGLPLQGRRVAILGDMAELGAQTGPAHAEIGKLCAELKIGQLFTVGKNSAATAKAARDAGLLRVIEFIDVEAAMKALKNFLKPGDVVLLKASRSSRLERIAETLKSEKS